MVNTLGLLLAVTVTIASVDDAAAVSEKHGDNPEWKSFSRRLVGVYRDAKKLQRQKSSTSEADYDLAVGRLEQRLAKLGSESWNHPDGHRLSKRMAKYSSELLTFLWYEGVLSDNNAGERAIRPAVMIRKNSYCNHSDRGALNQSVLMSVLSHTPPPRAPTTRYNLKRSRGLRKHRHHATTSAEG